MAAAQETPSGAGPEARMARLLGLSQRDDAALLSVRFSRGTSRGSCSQALDHRRWCHHAAHTRTSQERFHLLSEHGLWRRLPLSGEKLLADAAHFGLVINASLNSSRNDRPSPADNGRGLGKRLIVMQPNGTIHTTVKRLHRRLALPLGRRRRRPLSSG